MTPPLDIVDSRDIINVGNALCFALCGFYRRCQHRLCLRVRQNMLMSVGLTSGWHLGEGGGLSGLGRCLGCISGLGRCFCWGPCEIFKIWHLVVLSCRPFPPEGVCECSRCEHVLVFPWDQGELLLLGVPNLLVVSGSSDHGRASCM